jgi:hypothetical protein
MLVLKFPHVNTKIFKITSEQLVEFGVFAGCLCDTTNTSLVYNTYNTCLCTNIADAAEDDATAI